MKLIVTKMLPRSKVDKFVEQLMNLKYTNIRVEYDSVNHYKITAERELAEHEIETAGFGFMFPRA